MLAMKPAVASTIKMTTCSSSSSSSSSSRLIPRARAAPSSASISRSSLASPSSSPSQQLSHQRRRAPVVVARASSTASTSSLAVGASAEVHDAISTLKRAARRAWAVPASQTLAAILVLEKAKLIRGEEGENDSWLEALAGGRDGRRWRLMFTSGTDQVRKALSGEDDKAGGVYIPITAVQRWRLEGGKVIENGIYLGFLGALVFRGAWESKGRRLSFDFDYVRIRVGPWSKEFALKGSSSTKKAGDGNENENNDNKKNKKPPPGPFFLFAYADDDICVARGRGGGVAMWARASGDWQVKAGIDA